MKRTILFLVMTSCGADTQPAADVTTYEAEQAACVEKAATRQEADDCRDAVKRRFGRDAGR